MFWVNAKHCFIFVNQAFFNKVNGNFKGRRNRAFAAPGLEHIEFTVFDGKFHVLHVFIMLFKFISIIYKLVINFRHFFMKLRDRVGCACACNNIFTLGIDQVFTEENLFARGGVAGKGNARARIFVKVTENHGLNINRSAPGIGDVIHAAVNIGARIVPRAENSLDGLNHLIPRV